MRNKTVSIFTKILNDKEFSRSQKDWLGVNTMNLVISEVQRKQKSLKDEPSDKEVLSVLKGLIKSTEFTIDKVLERNKDADIKTYADELRIYNSYLPTLLSEECTKGIVEQVIKDLGATSQKDFGKVMGALKKIDNLNMKLASQFVKSYL